MSAYVVSAVVIPPGLYKSGVGRCEAGERNEAATRRLCRILNAQVGYADSPVGGAEEKGVVSGDGHLDANLG